MSKEGDKSILSEFKNIRDNYNKSRAKDYFNSLIYGYMGTGKTTILGTARKPVLIHSFDPGGEKVLVDQIKKGEVMVNSSFQHEDAKRPTTYRSWEKEFDRLRHMEGFFESIGTYALDSVTTWSEALMNAILKSNGRAAGIPQMQDYLVQINTLRDAIKLITSIPCDVILTGHVDSEKDEVTGRLTTGVMITGKLKEKLPLLMDEVYMATSKESSKGVEYSILTRNTGLYKARTRLGRNKIFDTYEEPNIKALLRKAGIDDSDKSLLIQ
jgi:hypothetical protein|tara:strand:+ start:1105 stop:1911 length:807 start_codon:yes stop_codon:yes gene_type:complete